MVLPDEHVVRPCPSTNSQRLPSPALPTAGGCFVSTCLTQHKHEKMTLLHLHLPSPFVAQRHEIAVTTVQSSDDAPRMLNSVSDQSLATNPTSMITQGSNLSRNLQKKKKIKGSQAWHWHTGCSCKGVYVNLMFPLHQILPGFHGQRVDSAYQTQQQKSLKKRMLS